MSATFAADLSDDLVFVEFAPVAPQGRPVATASLAPQHDTHADAWLDAQDLSAPSGFRVQPFSVVIDDANPIDCDAFALAAELADYPALHPDHFRFLVPVMLAQHHRPVPCVATLAVDDRGRVAMDDAWIFLPGRQARKVGRGEHFDRVKAEVFGSHLEDVMARAIEHRAFRPRALAAA